MGMKGEILINTENDQLLTAKESLEEKNRFLEENQGRILKLTCLPWPVWPGQENTINSITYFPGFFYKRAGCQKRMPRKAEKMIIKIGEGAAFLCFL